MAVLFDDQASTICTSDIQFRFRLERRDATSSMANAAPADSERAAIEVLDGYRRQVDVFDAVNIDRGHRVTLRIVGFAIRMNAADGAEAVFDRVLVERIGTRRVFGCEQMKLFPRDE